MKQIICIALFGFLLAGCSKKEAAVYAPEVCPVEIKIAASLPESPSLSRSLAESTTQLTGVQFLRQDGQAKPTDFSSATLHTGDRAGDAVGKIRFDDLAPMYNPDAIDDNAYLVAYFPIQKSKDTNVLHWEIDGTTDILRTDAIYEAGSFRTPAVGKKMIFEHQLARLEVVCKADPSVLTETDIQNLWGEITKIELMDTPAELLFDLATLTSQGSANKLDLPLLEGSSYQDAFVQKALTHNKTNVVTGAGMFVPNNETTVKLRITTAAIGVREVVVPLKDKMTATPKSFEVGKCHKITLTFKATKAIEVLSAEIKDWAEGYEGEFEVGV